MCALLGMYVYLGCVGGHRRGSEGQGPSSDLGDEQMKISSVVRLMALSLMLFGWHVTVRAEGVVLLTFDVEEPGDTARLERLDVDVPATYFITGEYARLDPDLVRRLAADGHTIGSHSHYHADLATLDADHLALDLEVSRISLEQIMCQPVEWFRAPFLSYDVAVMEEVARAGFLFDSSDKAPWPENPILPELAISVYGDRLVTDQDAIADAGVAPDDTPLLIQAFEAHRDAGRPLVVLAHPRYIIDRPDLLWELVEHATNSNAEFLTADAFRDRTLAGTDRRVLWLARMPEDNEIDALAARIREVGATDLILPHHVGDPPQIAEGLLSIAGAGTRLHLAVDPTAGTGPAPTLHAPGVEERLLRLVAAVAAEDAIAGLVLTGLSQPAQVETVSHHEIAAFSLSQGLNVLSRNDMYPNDYRWQLWRAEQTGRFLDDVRQAITRSSRPALSLGAVVTPAELLDHRESQTSGLDPLQIGAALDVAFVTLPDLTRNDATALDERLRMSAAVLLGDVDLMISSSPSEPDPGIAAGDRVFLGRSLRNAEDRIARLDEQVRRLPIACLASRIP